MALIPSKLANIDARPAPSIIIKATTPTGQMVSIGAVKKLDRRITRNMTRRRELDSNVPGITVEIVPGAVTDFSLTISRAMLNKSSMLEAFGISGVEDLIHQNIPIDIEEHRFMPDGKEQIVTYKSCYFKSNPQSIDIDADWVIVQDAELEVATALVQNPT
jgi:hypothetical protein